MKYSVDAVRKLIKKGLACIRPKLVPGNPPDVEEQEDFIREYKKLRLEMKENSGVILFCDVIHLIHQIILGFCWGDPKGPPKMVRKWLEDKKIIC